MTTKGVFMRVLSQDIHGYAHEAAQRASESGVNLVAILVSWQDNDHQRAFNGRRLHEYASAFVARGIDVHLWAYPWHGMEDLLIRTFRRRTEECDGLISGWIIDPELGYKWRGVAERTVRYEAEYLMENIVNNMDESLDLGVTSYGALHQHNRFPWDIFLKYGWLSPQVYGFRRPLLERSFAEWRRLSTPQQAFIPAIAGYGEEDEYRLAPWIDMMNEVDPNLDGFIVWSWRQLSQLEWNTIRDINWEAGTDDRRSKFYFIPG